MSLWNLPDAGARYTRAILVTFADRVSEELGYPVTTHLSATDFSADSTVEVRLRDGSQLKFCHAFYVFDEALRSAAVFTEHCGYFTFSSAFLLEVSQTASAALVKQHRF